MIFSIMVPLVIDAMEGILASLASLPVAGELRLLVRRRVLLAVVPF
jgi:hypothetical protein